LHDPAFSHFATVRACDRQTDKHMTIAYTALAIKTSLVHAGMW